MSLNDVLVELKKDNDNSPSFILIPKIIEEFNKDKFNFEKSKKEIKEIASFYEHENKHVFANLLLCIEDSQITFEKGIELLNLYSDFYNEKIEFEVFEYELFIRSGKQRNLCFFHPQHSKYEIWKDVIKIPNILKNDCIKIETMLVGEKKIIKHYDTYCTFRIQMFKDSNLLKSIKNLYVSREYSFITDETSETPDYYIVKRDNKIIWKIDVFLMNDDPSGLQFYDSICRYLWSLDDITRGCTLFDTEGKLKQTFFIDAKSKLSQYKGKGIKHVLDLFFDKKVYTVIPCKLVRVRDMKIDIWYRNLSDKLPESFVSNNEVKFFGIETLPKIEL